MKNSSVFTVSLVALIVLLPPTMNALTPMEKGAPLIFYLSVSVPELDPYLGFYPPEVGEAGNTIAVLELNSSRTYVHLRYPRIYMKTLYYKPSNSLPNRLNLSIKYPYFSPATLEAEVKIDLEGDEHYDLTYFYKKINLTFSLDWHKIIMNSTGISGVLDKIEWGVVLLNLSALVPKGGRVLISGGAEGQMSTLSLPFVRDSPNKGSNSSGSKSAFIILGSILLAFAGYIAWDIIGKKGGR